MKNTLKRLVIMNIFLINIIFASTIYAATANISASKTSAYVGDNVTINVSVNAAAWNLNVSGNGISGGNVTGFNIEGANQVTNKSYTLNTNTVGTYTIYLKGDISDGETDVTSDISRSVTVTVNAKPVVSAPPTTNNTTNTSPSVNTTTPKPSTNTGASQSTNNTLSSNAYLKEFRLDYPGITPNFSKTIYNYAITVDENINTLSVTAVPENNKATVSITGNTDLKEGENTILAKVTAQDKKTVNTYKIIVTKTDDPIKSNAYLQNIIVTDKILTPEFSSEVFEYDIGSVGEDVETLEISAFPVNEKSKVEIIGNDKLVIGENIIKIVVTSENEKIQNIYTLKVNKEEINSLKGEGTQNNKKDIDKRNNISTLSVIGEILKEYAPILLLYAFLWIEFLQVVYLYEKLKKYENNEERKEYKKIKKLTNEHKDIK